MIINSVEAAIDPVKKLTFLVDWELTLKCNLSCTYCEEGLYGGHDNSFSHPPVDECLKTLDFMYEYVDSYMKYKPSHSRNVVLNVYGGESLYHPNIVELMEAARSKHTKYKDNWTLTITTTTNATISHKKLSQLVNLVDVFTVSYHSESSEKQKNQLKRNLLTIKENGKPVTCIVLMHPINFQDCTNMIDFCKENNIKYLPRQLDHAPEQTQFNYKQEQVIWFDALYKNKSRSENTLDLPMSSCATDLSDVGRACCGGRQLVRNEQYSDRSFFVNNKFPDWHCSVNWFFLYVKQANGEIFVNKDCKMSFQGGRGPIGHLSDTAHILSKLKEDLSSQTLPTIQCKNNYCLCGLCAPKAKDLDTYNRIMQKYKLKNEVNK